MAYISLREYLKIKQKSYISKKVGKAEFKKYIENLKNTYYKIVEASQNNASEDNIKNLFTDFLKETFYNSHKNVQVNTFEKIDYAIKKNENLEVIMEFKKPSNKSEMITSNNMNKKALHEAIKYFYDEKYKSNYFVKHILITDGFSYFIFNASEFLNNGLEKLCFSRLNGDLYLQSTKDIYDALAKEISRQQLTFSYTCFDLNKLGKKIDKINIENINLEEIDKEIIYVYKLFHPDFLLNEYSPKDSNQLNKNFYDELLYILGLQEINENNKKLIKPNDNINGLINETIRQLKLQKAIYDETKLLNIAFELVVTWLNRILFLKLFEAQLVTFNDNDENFKFITSDKITDFDKLNHLFFAILGTKIENRDNSEYKHIPYLNSSLFELSEMEIQYFTTAALDNNCKIDLYHHSNVKRWNEYKNKPSERILKYLLDFLDSYDFSSGISDDLFKDDNRDIINSAVLGLIFEKLNGYKDGSFYTPGFITEYMAQTSINKVIVNKFNEKYSITPKLKNIEEVKNYIEGNGRYSHDKISEYNEIIDSLRICDPAVGSGHFLVSILNYLIYLKSFLGILWDGKNLIGNNIEIFDDTLIVFDDDLQFSYRRKDKSTHRIQKALFNEKRNIIENCLFAVDINPKSVYICQLRLWIELLKNTYYHEDSNEMEILPNIDINIKPGNSLISKYSIKANKSITQDGSKKLRDDIKEYKQAVNEYKRTGDKLKKQDVKNKIVAIKSQLVSSAQYDLFKDNRKLLDENIYKNSMEWMLEFPEILDEDGKFQGFDIVIGNPPYIQLQAFKGDPIQKVYANAKFETFNSMGDIYCLFYEQGIKLLKTDGILCYITSNKWMRAGYGEKLRSYFVKYNPSLLIDVGANVFDSATVDTNILIVEKSEYKHQTLSCDLIKKDRREKMSDYIQQNAYPINYTSSAWTILSPIEQSIKDKIEKYGTPLKDWNVTINYGIKTGCNEAFIIDDLTRSELIAKDPKSAELIRPILRGRDIKRYGYDFAGLYLINIECGYTNRNKGTVDAETWFKETYPAIYEHFQKIASKTTRGKGLINRDDKGEYWWELRSCAYTNDFSQQKIIWKRVGSILRFCLDDKNCLCLDSTCFLTGENILYLLAILNSRMGHYLLHDAPKTGTGDLLISVQAIEPLKIPLQQNVNSESVRQIVEYTKQILNGSYSFEIEQKLDNLICSLYDLSEEESQYIISFT